MSYAPSSFIWLDLRSGAPGLEGPFLLEYNAPYRYFDELAHQRPRVILAIGGQLKRKRLAEQLSIKTHVDEFGTICLRPLPKIQDAVLIDCELHLREDPPRVLGGPCPGHYKIHCLDQSRSVAPVIARRLYCDILAQFSTEILIFVADLCGLQNTIDFLVQWIRGLMLTQIPMRPLVHLILDDSQPLSNKELWILISAQLLEHLRISEPTHPYTFREVQQIGRDCLNLQAVQDQTGNVLANWASPDALKLTRGRDYQSQHLKFLLRAAIGHFAKQWAIPFNIYLASRLNNPLPHDWQYHVLSFLQSTKETGKSQYAFVASAFAMSAFPPGMHRMYHPLPIDFHSL